MAKAKHGRPTLLNARLQRQICKLLQEGCDQKTACSIIGVGERTFHEWKSRGQNGEEPYASFLSAASRARNVFKARLLRIIVAAANKEARHAEWLLEKYWPNEFGRSEPRTIVIERPPSIPSPEPETRPGKPEKWFTPERTGIPFDKKALDYLAALRRAESQPLRRNGAE